MQSLDKLDSILPSYLTEQKKDRIKDGLRQFVDKELKHKHYTDFYLPNPSDFFLQGDLIKEIRFPIFDKSKGTYDKKYYDAIIISNACDIDFKQREIPKNVMLAMAIPFDEFKNDLAKRGIKSFDDKLIQVKNQMFTNLFYLPSNSKHDGYIVPLDYIAQISIEELESLKSNISKNRISSLDHFGYYLFMFKLSFHFCRLPEEHYR